MFIRPAGTELAKALYEGVAAFETSEKVPDAPKVADVVLYPQAAKDMTLVLP